MRSSMYSPPSSLRISVFAVSHPAMISPVESTLLWTHCWARLVGGQFGVVKRHCQRSGEQGYGGGYDERQRLFVGVAGCLQVLVGPVSVWNWRVVRSQAVVPWCYFWSLGLLCAGPLCRGFGVMVGEYVGLLLK